MNELFTYDVKYRDRNGNIRIFSCLAGSSSDARNQARRMVCDINDFSGVILNVRPIQDELEWDNGILA